MNDLAQWATFFADVAPGDRFVCVADAQPSGANPGWSVRHVLNLLWHHYAADLRTVPLTVVCLRECFADGASSLASSVVLHVTLSDAVLAVDPVVSAESGDPTVPHVMGWEKNHKQKLAPRVCDLSAQMDPVKLADAAVGLNLQLMKWRLLPSINLEVVAATKCLLLGAGTLGCNVARVLLVSVRTIWWCGC
jgi:ubiquitin-like modifier-activating enzyme ATG7